LPKTNRAYTVKREYLMVCDVHNANVDKNASAILIGSNLIAESAVRYMAFLSVIFDRNGNFKTIFHSDNTTMQKTLILRRCFQRTGKCVFKNSEQRLQSVFNVYGLDARYSI